MLLFRNQCACLGMPVLQPGRAWQSHIPPDQHLLYQASGITAVHRVVVCIPVPELLPPSGRFGNTQFTDRALQQLGKSKWAPTVWLEAAGAEGLASVTVLKLPPQAAEGGWCVIG